MLNSLSSRKRTMSVIYLILPILMVHMVETKDEPRFLGSETNVTAVIGRDATLTCSVENLLSYKVAWLRVDTQTILTIGHHVITKNHRIGIARGDQAWTLILREVKPADGGLYMCQINTEPMITQTHHLHVSVPPDIANSSSSGEVIVREGDDVSLHCTASGTPQPTIIWRREDSGLINIGRKSVGKWNGVWFNLTAVGRKMNGAFLCIATNGVPPSVSKRILLRVLCKPSVWVTPKFFGAYTGDSILLQCIIEAYPPPVVYWIHIDGNKLQNGTKYQASIKSQEYRHTAELRITDVSRRDIGSYHCHAENHLGSANDDVTVYTLATTTSSTSTTTQASTTIQKVLTTSVEKYTELEVNIHEDGEQFSVEDSFLVVLSQQQMQNLDLSPSS